MPCLASTQATQCKLISLFFSLCVCVCVLVRLHACIFLSISLLAHSLISITIGDLHDYIRYYRPRLLMVNHQFHQKCIGIHDW